MYFLCFDAPSKKRIEISFEEIYIINRFFTKNNQFIPFWILEPWILKVLPVGSFSNLNVATIKQNGITK